MVTYNHILFVYKTWILLNIPLMCGKENQSSLQHAPRQCSHRVNKVGRIQTLNSLVDLKADAS